MNYGMRSVTLHRRQRSRPSPWKRNAKKQNGCLGEALQIAVKRREAKSKGEKERYKHLNAKFQRTVRRDKKDFLSDQSQGVEENNTMEILEIPSRKLEIPREHSMQTWAR